MQVKYSFADVSAFEKHKVIIPILMVALVIYGISWAIEVKLRANESNYQTIAGNIRLLSSSLVIVLLILMLVPYFGWMLLTSWALLFIWVAWKSYKEMYQLLLQAFNGLKKLTWDMRHRMLKKSNQLPVVVKELAHNSTVDEGKGLEVAALPSP
ncbi:uncharacterized protein LOC110643703 [Hevea brasiliensis]|uniref:uncharacterized protein LOC110643703 n=1 Tax=Hevea brasiliensis TaxID=3981 RepID=UPI0026000C92|nr:uncharacterized protein LOC110643703 [Hevea brasiliensis]